MKRTYIGGQAVTEGVMMMGPESYALSVRKPDGEIAVTVTPFISLTKRVPWLNIPVIRGIVQFVQSLYIGIRTMLKAAEYGEDEEEAEKTREKEQSHGYLAGIFLFSLIFAVALFVLLPALLAGLLYHITDSSLLVNVAEGVVRIAIFLGYVRAISSMEEIRRTFMYHGAEHKTINCMEAGHPLTVENVRKASRFHRRCGTSFVFLVMLVSIVVFMFVRTDSAGGRLLSRVVLIPLVAGISYELIRYAGMHQNRLSRILSAPGVWLQKMTTREPDDTMIEVAIRSVEGVIDWREYIRCVNNRSFEQ